MKLAFLFAALCSSIFTYAQMDSLSYNFGLVLAKNVKSQGLPIEDQDAFVKGFRAFLDGSASEKDVMEANMAIQNHMQKMSQQKSSAAKQEGDAFLAKNAERPEIKVTASGLQYEVLQEGAGEHPSATSKVTVHYTGKNLDGSVFDSSVERGEPTTFGLNQVISGWTEGVQLMKPGAKYRFYIPSDLAYGDRGAGADIAPGATLMFDIELISVN